MRTRRTTRAYRKRENKALQALAAYILGVISGIVIVIIFVLLIWNDGRQSKEQTDGQAEQMPQTKQLTIEIPKAEKEGSVTIYANGAVYGYFGDIDIINDGTDGNQIEIELTGWLVGSIGHGEPESEAWNE